MLIQKWIKSLNKPLAAFYTLIAIGIIGLTSFVLTHPISSFDINITHEIQELKMGHLSTVMEIISIFGDPAIAFISVIVVSLLFLRYYYQREAYFTIAVLLPDLFNILIKILIHRPRPTLENAKMVFKFSQTAFPSGHVVHYVVFFGFLLTVMIINKRILPFWRLLISIFSIFLILTVSISRIYLGAHWATDVLGGYLFGFLYLGIILKFYLQKAKR